MTLTEDELYERIYDLEVTINEKEDEIKCLTEQLENAWPYVKIDKELYKKISDITFTDYEPVNDCVSKNNIESMLSDLADVVEHLEEKVNYERADKLDNYEPIGAYKMYGLDPKDF